MEESLLISIQHQTALRGQGFWAIPYVSCVMYHVSCITVFDFFGTKWWIMLAQPDVGVLGNIVIPQAGTMD